ncbi:LOW QUALITY PROTEIN: G-protein coupled receptor 157 [Oryx dammah]|uniref:LOW QUALITY PROTEIN: G-protein coupled receptor 157 n=1 Tax=Oryx dammah TaxID=59534 RepID=UPI001A9AC632|nr:LOW QUALITY PROTEIN: G-protein coupled receptor 157 [Oryx dammah]
MTQNPASECLGGCVCPGGRPGQLLCPFSWAWAEQSWVGGFEDSSPPVPQGPCLLQPWESTGLVCTASWSLHPCWLCWELGLTSPRPVCSLLFSWGVPLAITVAAVALKKIGYDASDVSVGWCWISLEAEDRVLWMLLTGKLWELLAYLTLPVLYLLIRNHIHRAHAELLEYRPIVSEAHQLQHRTSVADKKLVLIPLIFICLRVWSTVCFILTLCGSPAVRMPVLVVLHGIGNTFQGGANGIMFVFCTRAVRTPLLSLCCCCSPQPPAAESPAGPPKAPAPSKSGESQRGAHTGGKGTKRYMYNRAPILSKLLGYQGGGPHRDNTQQIPGLSGVGIPLRAWLFLDGFAGQHKGQLP